MSIVVGNCEEIPGVHKDGPYQRVVIEISSMELLQIAAGQRVEGGWNQYMTLWEIRLADRNAFKKADEPIIQENTTNER